MRRGPKASDHAWLFAMAFITAAPVALAHDTWLLASIDARPTSAAAALELTSGMRFPAADYAVRANRIAAGGCRTLNGSCRLTPGSRGAHALGLVAANAAPAAIVWIDLAAKTLTLTAAKVDEYFDEIDASAEIRATWRAMPAPKQWRETYTKHAKAMIGDIANTAPWSARPIGQSLEIVPVPSQALRSGGSASFKVLKHGQPLSAFPIGVLGSADGKPRFLHTDAAGQVMLTFDRAGPWLLRVTDLRAPVAKGGAWRSDFATLTLPVR